MNHIIAVEGFGGYPFWQKRIPRKIATKEDMLFGLGPSQVFNFVIPLFSSRPDFAWEYYPQFMVWPIVRKIRELRKTKKPNDRIILIGFSYGGSAVHAVSHWFREKTFDLVISLDPVGKWRRNVAREDPTVYRFSKPESVVRWVNFYQQLDKCSFAPGNPWLTRAIWGGKVSGADRETRLFPDDYLPERIYNDGVESHGIPEVRNFSDQAHMWLPAQNEVQRQIKEELEL